MDEDILEKYRRAGKIAREVREFGVKIIRPGMKVLHLVERMEERIISLGGELAFPVNISINNVSAHFSPKSDDVSEFKEGDVVKIDVGVHIDGYIADTAVTVELETDRYSNLIISSKEALDKVIELLKPGIEVGKIGKIISETIESRGFKPIKNLSGHSMDRYILHSGLSIPNIGSADKSKLEEGMAIAIEPFASTGSGYVKSKGWSNIYRYIHSPVFRDIRLRFLAKKIKERFKTLPFAERWFVKAFPNMMDNLNRLVSSRCVYHYPRLVDDGIVSQHEHTVIITRDGCEVIT